MVNKVIWHAAHVVIGVTYRDTECRKDRETAKESPLPALTSFGRCSIRFCIPTYSKGRYRLISIYFERERDTVVCEKGGKLG